MRLANTPQPPNYGNAPLPLDYGVASRVGCASIETYPDGVFIRALIPRARYWLRFALGAAIAMFLIAIAIPSGDNWNLGSLHAHREGTVARIAAAVMGTVMAIALTAGLLRGRRATTLTARGGRLAYTEASIRGETCFECPLKDIEPIEHEPWDGDTGGTLSIMSRGSGRRQLFGDLDAKEVEAIAEVLLPVWKAASGGGAA